MYRVIRNSETRFFWNTEAETPRIGKSGNPIFETEFSAPKKFLNPKADLTFLSTRDIPALCPGVLGKLTEAETRGTG
ncbi:unnamed protein product [Meloidogyne enterolobii]|uniref:Uncharacterized protein n=1 Tax=Meloidogyne enterolobii TaxID=390850 RepID=A0ACB1B7B6_MELEN